MAERYRNWVVIAYPESMPENVDSEQYLDSFLKKLLIPCCRSPLHHGYGSEEAADERKDHFHVLLTFGGVKSVDQIKTLLLGLPGKIIKDDTFGTDLEHRANVFSFPVPCNSVAGSVRYFAHLDNPEKEKLSFSDIREFGGFDKYEIGSLNSSEQTNIMAQMDEYIESNDLIEYKDLVDAAHVCSDEWYWVLLHTSYRTHISLYLTSKRNQRSEVQRMCDLLEKHRLYVCTEDGNKLNTLEVLKSLK